MDTKGVKYANWKRLETAQDCGQWETEFRLHSGSSFKIWSCKTWDCLKCLKMKILKIKELLNQNINGPHVFISHIENRNRTFEDEIGRESNNWISSHRPRVPNFFYLSIRTFPDILLISSHGFRNHPFVRISKRRYIDKDLPEYLLEHHREIINISHSRISNQGPKGQQNSANPVLIKFRNEHNDNIEHQKFSEEIEKIKHKTEREIAEWLESSRSKEGYHLTKDGYAFIRRHLRNHPENNDS